MRLALLLVGVWMLLAQPCRADTDYLCLNRCVQGGKASAQCMADCRYGQPTTSASDALGQAAAPVKPSKIYENPHRLLNAPKPMGNDVTLTAPPPHTEPPAKDYRCLKDCLQPGVTYPFCEQQCVLHPLKKP